VRGCEGERVEGWVGGGARRMRRGERRAATGALGRVATGAADAAAGARAATGAADAAAGAKAAADAADAAGGAAGAAGAAGAVRRVGFAAKHTRNHLCARFT
jgi:hypothetical protein